MFLVRIANNVPALFTHIHLRRNDRLKAASMNRLSTGLRINSAREDAAGMAIANKLSYQLVGLERASDNSTHGISLVQTAEGALNEVHAMLQRMRQLAVQAANDTNVTEDRVAIQNEIDALTDEISALSRRTEFNTIKLLGGEAARVSNVWTGVGAGAALNRMAAHATAISENMQAGTLHFNVMQQATPAELFGGGFLPGDTAATSGLLKINGVMIHVDEGDSLNDVWARVMEDAPHAGVTTDAAGSGFTSIINGSRPEINLGGSEVLWAQLGFDMNAAFIPGEDIQLSPLFMSSDTTGEVAPVLHPDGTLLYTADGNRVTIRTPEGHTVEMIINEPGQMQLRIEEFGGLRIQIGPNHNMNMRIQIPRMNAETLGLAESRGGQFVRLMQVTHLQGALHAIDQADHAIRTVSGIRTRLGAYQNRLEHTVNNLDNSAVNTAQARSRVQDTDMAREMTMFSKRNVMYQAGLAILGQANQRPQMVLSLLQ